MSGFEISRIEIFALRKLELVSKALATKLTGMASREQQCLADTLGDVLDRYEIEASRPTSGAKGLQDKPDMAAERKIVSDVMIPPAPDGRIDRGNR